MSEKIKFDVQNNGNVSTVLIQGAIDEDFTTSFLQDVTGESIVFDFQNLTLINSCGIREWIRLIENLNGKQITYSKCPKILIDQVNMVEGFFPDYCKIDTFYAPYYSEDKDEEVDVLLNVSEVGDDLKAPSRKDESSQEELEFDDIEAQYFAFIKRN